MYFDWKFFLLFLSSADYWRNEIMVMARRNKCPCFQTGIESPCTWYIYIYKRIKIDFLEIEGGWIKRCPHPFQGFKTDETEFRLSSSRFEKSNGKSVLSGETIRQSTFLIVFDNEHCPCTQWKRATCVCVCAHVDKTGNSDPFLWTNEWNFYRRGLRFEPGIPVKPIAWLRLSSPPPL